MANSIIQLKNGSDILSPQVPAQGIGNRTYNKWDNTRSVLYVGNEVNGGNYRVVATSANDCPSDLPVEISTKITGDSCVVYRQSFTQVDSTLTHSIVILYEIYPTPGRIWINAYNESWKGWKKLTPT